MDEFVWALPRHLNSEVPIGARILAAFDSRFKVKDDNNKEYWLTREEIVRPMHPTSILGVEDMISLEDLQEYSILRNLHMRYSKDLIYTYIGSILVGVNPYKSLPIYGKSTMIEYRKRKLGELPPHIFAVADHSYENMRKKLEKRCIVISGESGAGKTESTKLFLRYFAGIAVKQSVKEQQILDSNPILEAFGNAKTICNHNSSRFGKYIAINFNTDGSIHSAQIKHYLLEKSRIVSQNSGEANYHIFYAVLNGLSTQEKELLKLKEPAAYNYLNGKKTQKSPEDEKSPPYNLEEIKSAMLVLNFSESEIWSVFQVISAILNLGNIEFESSSVSNIETVTITTQEEIRNVCELLKLSERHLVDSLTKKTISTQGENVIKSLPKQQATDSRDAFVKRIYGNLFNFIVDKINKILYNKDRASDCDIGILDIFGFEQFERNSFEQLCINYANEKLQQFFIGHIFKAEQEQYRSEGINWKYIDYPDNKDILDLIEAGPKSLLSVINDETKFPNGTDKTMLDKLIEFNSENPLFFKPKYKNTPVFGIRHFAGVVLYDVKDFLEKNHDACNLDIKQVVQSSSDDFLKKVFADDFEADSNAYYKKRTETLASKFKNSLDSLMAELNQCQPFFVRCIKPNEMKKPHKFDRMLCCKQLRYSGMTETTKVREAGYPIRHDFVQFVQRYRILVSGIPLAHKTSCKAATAKICETVFRKFPSADYQLGRTKIFMKHVEGLFLENERDKCLYSYVVTIQKVVRGWLARRRYMKLKKAVLLLEKTWIEWQNRSEGNKVRNGFYRLQARIRSRQEAYQFQRYRQWVSRLQAYCRGYLIRNLVKGKLQEIKSKDRTEIQDQNATATFQEFAESHFQDKHNHQFTKKPIKSSLTRLVHPDDRTAATTLWMTILRYTGNVQEPKKSETKISVNSQIREILRRITKDKNASVAQKEESGNAAEMNQLYENWLKSQTTNLEKIYFVVGHGIARSEIRDEIYCQICKIITKNPSQKGADRGWELLSTCTGCFPPSDLFLKHLKGFIRTGPGKYSSFCLFRLQTIIQSVPRSQPPCHTEMEAIAQQKAVDLKVFLMNGETVSTKVDSTTTAREMIDTIAKIIKLTDTFGFSLVLAQEMKYLSLGDGYNYVLDAIAECEQYVMEIGGNFNKTHWKLYLKKEILAPWQDQISDEVSSALICSQIQEGIRTGEYGYGAKDLPTVIAQLCYSEQGRVLPAVLNQVIEQYIPLFVHKMAESDLVCFKEQVKFTYQQMFGRNQRAINSVRADLVKYATENWSLPFSRFFHVPGTIKNSKSSVSYPEVPLVVAVNSSGVLIIDESNEKSIVAEFEYMEIKEISRKEVAEGKEYILKIGTYEGIEVSLALRTAFDINLHELLIKILETLKKYSKFAISIKNYKSLDTSFLDLEKGDLIVLGQNFTGKDLLQNYWAEGTNERTGKTGAVLLDCVDIIPTMKKPTEVAINSMRGACYAKKTIQLWQSAERLKHYNLESYAQKYFRTEHGEVRTKPSAWKYSNEEIQRPLLTDSAKVFEESLEMFSLILKYTEKTEEEVLENEEQLIQKIFQPALENDLLKNEIYCQIMKQLTSNSNKESENNAWELMWMLTGLFACGENLAKEVKKFLQSRRTMQIARECLTRFYMILRSSPRKTTPHLMEIEAVKQKPCQILYKVYFPDESHRFFQINSLTKAGDLTDVILNRLKLNSFKGFGLFVQIKQRLFSIPDDYYIFDYFQCLRRWIEKYNIPYRKWQHQICFMKYTWISAIPGNNDVVDSKFLFPQEYNKYIQGFYDVPTEDIIKLAALLYVIQSGNKQTQPFRLILPKIIPQRAFNWKNIETWQKEIESAQAQQSVSTEKECRLEFLNYFHRLPSYSLQYFSVNPEKLNQSNYMLYPVTSNSRLVF